MTPLRRLARQSSRSANRLLDAYRLPHISESHFIISPEAWDFLADLDQLQADLAGSLTWEPNSAGGSRRAEIRNTCLALSTRAASIGLEDVSAGLRALGDALDEGNHKAIPQDGLVDKIERARALAAAGKHRAALILLRELATREGPPYRSRLALAQLYREMRCPDQAGRWGIISAGWTTEYEQDRLARLLAASGVASQSARDFLRIPSDVEEPADLPAVLARVPTYRARFGPRWDWDPIVVRGGRATRLMRGTAKWLLYLAGAASIITMIGVFQQALTDGDDTRRWAVGGSLLFVALLALAAAAYGVSRWTVRGIWSGLVFVGLGVVLFALVIAAARA